MSDARGHTDGLAIFVIGSEGALRSPSLQSALRRSPYPSRILPPFRVTPDDAALLADEVAAEIVFGRTLTPGEIGCWFAHRSVYEEAVATGCRWALVLEDDAGLPPDIWTRLPSWLRDEVDDRPTIVSLFAQDHAKRAREIQQEDGELVTLPYAPTNTVAYLINRAALKVATASPRRAMSTADWPPWSMGIQYKLVAKSPVTHLGESVIGSRPEYVSGRRTIRRLREVLSPQAWAAGRPYFNGRWSYMKWSIIVPARKGVRRARKRLRVPGPP